MRLRPILFQTPMVQAIKAGIKTQTRRLLKPQPEPDDSRRPVIYYGWPALAHSGTEYINARPPYGKVGDVLWVRETFFEGYPYENDQPQYERKEYWYYADTRDTRPGDVSDEWCINEFGLENKELWPRWKPSIYMPFEACRLFLEITGLRLERLQDIETTDAVAEGIQFDYPFWRDYQHPKSEGFLDTTNIDMWRLGSPKICVSAEVASYASLWDSINDEDGKRFLDNPWVWVVEFKQIEKPV